MSWLDDVLNNGLPNTIDSVNTALDSYGRLTSTPASLAPEKPEQAPPQNPVANIAGPSALPKVPQAPASSENVAAPAPAMMGIDNSTLMLIGLGVVVLLVVGLD